MEPKVIHQYRTLEELSPLEDNPRKLTDPAFKKLAESVKNNPDYFEARPIILSNRTGKLVILGGNQRYAVAKFLGLKQVPTVLIPGLTEAREREIIIRDNVNNGDWDFEKLANEWDLEELNEWDLFIPDLKPQEPEEFSGEGSGTKRIVLVFDEKTYAKVKNAFNETANRYGLDPDEEEAIFMNILDFYREKNPSK